MNNYFHINDTQYDAIRIMEEMISNPPEWKLKGLEFMIQMLDPSHASVNFFTSGTTGTPKLISFNKNQILQSAKNTCRFLGINNTSTLYLCLPADKVAGRLMLVRALVSGAKIIWEEPSLHPLKTHFSIDIAAFTPAQVSALLSNEESKKVFENIHQVIIGGGAVSYSLENELKKLNNTIYATYGMTETLTHVAMRKVGEEVYHSIHNEVVFTVNENNCLQIYLPFISNNLLVTNDVVELLSTTSFKWKGRFDNVVNSGGVKIYPEEIEKTLLEAGVLKQQDFYITSQSSHQFGESPVIVMLNVNTPGDTDTFLKNVNGLLKKHEIVKAIYIIDKFEYTDTGKLKRIRF